MDRTSRVRPSLPIVLAGVIVVGTGLGLVISANRFGLEFAKAATFAWAVGIATAFVTLGATARVPWATLEV